MKKSVLVFLITCLLFAAVISIATARPSPFCAEMTEFGSAVISESEVINPTIQPLQEVDQLVEKSCVGVIEDVPDTMLVEKSVYMVMSDMSYSKDGSNVAAARGGISACMVHGCSG